MNRSRRLALAMVCGLAFLVGSSLPASAAPGDVDDSFASLGLLTQAHANVEVGTGITRGPEGRFVIAWSASNEVGVSGFLGNGAEDAGFGSGGMSTIAVPGATSASVSDSAVDAKGRTIVIGYAAFPSTYRMLVARFTSTGDPDTAFSDDGVRTIGFSRGESYAYGVAVRGGKIYMCGQVYTGAFAPADPVVVRLDGAGSLDPSFGFGGRRVYKVPDGFAGDDSADAIQPVANGRLVLVGGVASAQGQNTLIMRILGDGRRDQSFKGDGYHVMNLRKGGSDTARDVERDGSKLVLGVAGNDFDNSKIVRLRADGSRDTTFSGDGVGTYPFGSGFVRLREIEVDANHRVYAVAYSTDLPAIRVRANGTLATGYGDVGLATNPDTSTHAWDAMLRGNLLYVTGAANGMVNATRYLP